MPRGRPCPPPLRPRPRSRAAPPRASAQAPSRARARRSAPRARDPFADRAESRPGLPAAARRAPRAARRCRLPSSRSPDAARGSRRAARRSPSGSRCGPGFRRSTLLRAITTGTPSAKTRWAMKRSPAPIRSRADEDEQHRVDVLERAVDGALHALGQGVERPLEPRQVDEHELVAVAVRDADDPPARRLRLVGDDRHLAAGRARSRASTCRRSAGRRRRRSRTSQLERVGQQLRRRRVTTSPSALLNVTRSMPELVHPLPAAAAGRRGDRDLLEVAGPAPATTAAAAPSAPRRCPADTRRSRR